MNPVAYCSQANPIFFLLIGEVIYRLTECGMVQTREWTLNVYSTDRSRRIAEKKMKRGVADVIFIEWDVTMAQIVREGRLAFPVASEKVPKSDKNDIIDQLQRQRRRRE